MAHQWWHSQRGTGPRPVYFKWEDDWLTEKPLSLRSIPYRQLFSRIHITGPELQTPQPGTFLQAAQQEYNQVLTNMIEDLRFRGLND